MKNRKYEKVTTNKVTVKGILSDDCTYITFENDDKEEEQISLKTCFKPFSGDDITLIIGNKIPEDLEAEFDEEDEG